MIQIRNVPPEVHRALKARAALAGKSMSEMILEELRAMLSLPSERELRERLDHAEAFAMTKSSAGLIRRERNAA
jgi:plasmid stability protein